MGGHAASARFLICLALMGCGRIGYDLLGPEETRIGADASTQADGALGAPLVEASITATPQQGVLSFRFDASGSRSNDPPLRYAWDFGDGDTGAGESLDHAYATAGIYNASVTVSTASGLTDTATLAVDADPLRIVGLTWWNADKGTVIGPLIDGQFVDLYQYRADRLGLNIEAHVAGGAVGSVVMDLPGSTRRTEDTAPFFLGGDLGGVPVPWTPSTLGPQRLTVTAYTGAGATGTAGPTRAVDFELAYSNAQPVEIGGFVLVDSTTDQDLGPLNDMDVIDLGVLGVAAINIRIGLVPGDTGSIRLTMLPTQPPMWEGQPTNREFVPPHSVAGDAYGDYHDWTPAPGTYMLSATPYSHPFAGGIQGTTVNLQFDVQ